MERPKQFKEAQTTKCSHCNSDLYKQVKGKTIKRVEILARTKYIYIDIENHKLPLKITCPTCGRPTSLEFILEELTGITLSFRGESFEIVNGKKKRITDKDEKDLRKIYLKLNPSK